MQEGKTCYLRVMGRLFLVTIQGVADDTVWVTFPGVDYPVKGMGVELEFHDTDGLQSYHTQVVIGREGKGEGIVLRRSPGGCYIKHRQNWRVPTDLPIRLRDVGRMRERMARMINLSSEGTLIETDVVYEVGSSADLVFTLPKQPTCTLTARVIRHENEGQRQRPRFALWFAKVPNDARRALTWFLWKRIQELYPSDVRSLYPRSRRPRPTPMPRG